MLTNPKLLHYEYILSRKAPSGEFNFTGSPPGLGGNAHRVASVILDLD